MKRIAVAFGCVIVMWGVSFAQETKPKIQVVKDRGWSVCRALVKELRALPTMDQSIVCGGPSPLPDQEFPAPIWEELPVGEYLDVIYKIETAIRKARAKTIPPIEIWRTDYLAQIKSETIHPKLREAKLRFITGGPEQTVLNYIPNADQTKLCRDDAAKGEPVLAVGGYIFPYNPVHRRAIFIYPRSGSGDGSDIPHQVLLYGANAYLLGVIPLDQETSIFVVSRVIRRDPTREGTEVGFYADEVCNVHYGHVSPAIR